MGNLMLWALTTGFITGAVWVSIVLLRRPHPAPSGEPEPPPDVRHRLAELDTLRERLAEVEERLDYAERVLAQDRTPRLPPS